MNQSRSRRKFLADSVKSLTLLGVPPLVSNFIVQSIASVANAQAAVATDKIYLFFCFPGGPPRWMFDLPLTPNSNSAGTKYTDAFAHTGLGTFVDTDGSNKTQVYYKPWYDADSKYWLPPVWGSNPYGGSFKNCLSNAAFIRGIDLEINNHSLGRLRNQSPIIGGYSIAGVLAQKCNNPFPAASLGSISDAFKSEKAISPVILTTGVDEVKNVNPIKTLADYFSSRNPDKNLAVDYALAQFNSYADSHAFAQEALVTSKERADSLIELGVSTFTTQWQPVYDKYKGIVAKAMSRQNTEKFMASKTLPVPPNVNSMDDVRNQFLDKRYIDPNLGDVRKLIGTNTSIKDLATVFATVEILITSGLTQVVTADLGALTNMVINGTGATADLTNDQHFVGSVVSTIATTYLYRGVLCCTEELISVLKSAGKFDKTVIQFGAEFNRTAKASGAGSDHGFKGGSALLISGMIQKTTVLGNIKSDTDNTYKGFWGLAATHILTDNEYPIRINDVSKTVSGMLGVRHVANNGVFLLKNNIANWSSFEPQLAEVKNVV